MPSLFRRKPVDLIEESTGPAAAVAEPVRPGSVVRPRGHTPSKKELGRQTPKRSGAQRRRVPEPPPKNRRQAYQRMRERQRAERTERMAGMRAGDDAYLMPRDRGPERALTRDIVDSRRTVGTWFFGGALVVLIGSSGLMPPVVRLASNVVWATLAVAMIVDSVLISRRVGRLIRERHPQTTQKLGSLYVYAIMRALSFRRLRIPQPRVKPGQQI